MSACNFLPHVSGSTDACCQQHDRDYAIGTRLSRSAADHRLRACLLQNGNPRWKVELAYALVRVFGWMFYKGRFE